jgi:hypothetical protein
MRDPSRWSDSVDRDALGIEVLDQNGFKFARTAGSRITPRPNLDNHNTK